MKTTTITSYFTYPRLFTTKRHAPDRYATRYKVKVAGLTLTKGITRAANAKDALALAKSIAEFGS